MKILIPIVENTIKNVETPYGRSLYEIERKTILQYICESLMSITDAEFIFIIHKDDAEKFHMGNVIKLLIPDAKIVITQGKTQGSACSCLLAFDYFEMDEPLIIVGGDQLVTINLQNIVNHFVTKNYDGGVVIFNDIHPRWSYVKLDERGFVIEAAEKHPISNHATTGFYFFKHTSNFVNATFSMIKKEASVDGKFYVCPCYNEMILDGMKIGTFPIDRNCYYNFNHVKGIEMCEEYLRKINY